MGENRKRFVGAIEASVTLGVFAVLHRADFLGELPLATVATLMVVTIAINWVLRRVCSSEDSVLHRHARIAVQQCLIGSIIYAIGWGPTLAVGFLVVVADDLQANGSRVWRAAVVWTMVAMAAGQIAIAAGIVGSYIDEPSVHGLAVLSALGTAFVIRLLGLKTAEVERETAERSRAETALASRERRFRSLAENASDVVILTDTNGVITYVSASVERILGHPADHYLASSAFDHLHPDDAGVALALVTELVDDPTMAPTVELRALHADGTFHWQEFTARNRLADADISGIVVNFRDVCDRHARLEQLTYEASHDSLTALPNRQAFHDRVDHALARVARGRSAVAVLFCDIDGFKLLNDRLGHHLGDQVLIEIADRLRSAVRPADTVARIAGDEFTVLLEDLQEPGEAEAVARRLCAAVSAPVIVEGEELTVTMSVGVAQARQGDTVDTIVANADLAMYDAKSNGRDRVQLYEVASRLVLDQNVLEADMRTATARDEYRLHFQAIVDTAAEQVIAVEALVRWAHPERGLLGPDQFIPIAERTGYIMPLGRWVLEEACRCAARWQRSHKGLVLCVNVSALQLREKVFVEQVRAALDASGLPPSLLALELTESALIDADQSRDVIEAIRLMGVRLVIDDFGTGYSSLAYLGQLPVDGIKIDRSFVRELGTVRGDRMIKAIVELARGMDFWVVAEGVETAGQAEAIRQLGCHFAQGYHFARPTPTFPPLTFRDEPQHGRSTDNGQRTGQRHRAVAADDGGGVVPAAVHNESLN